MVTEGQFVVGEAEFLGAEEERDRPVIRADGRPGLRQGQQRLLQFPVSDGRGADHQGAVLQGIREGGVQFGRLQDRRSTDGRDGLAKSRVVGVYDFKIMESEITNCSRRRPNIQRVAGLAENYTDVHQPAIWRNTKGRIPP